jgi:hypothetical protein
MSEMGVVDGIIDTGVDVITQANLQEYEAGLDAKSIPLPLANSINLS